MNKRLFIAIDPPSDIREQLTGLCCGLPDARWVAPEQLHLTLCFIGEVSGSVFLDIREALDEIRAESFALRFKGVGFFPPRGQPRVVWAGVEKNEALITLQRKITTRLTQLGVALENRKFTPHLTLARLNQTPPSRVGRYLQEHALFALPEFLVEEFILYSSVLGRKGASHTVEQVYSLTQEQGTV
ncbi:RNA 2',3'-cyclic phosphodiesterase [Desulfobulbus alkaliphilus]|uniref:RNA 2',3'-cyclic phosphodiesterase n=1 Tax=Desulfobulbus alkaliphilus TaxID=869814 RepID=UPI0019664534|nr:RNA 2',3'-cyclic phosphodiesterase [Desulfobulbus alkaliphilus]MBM9536154.1 RNA 2',3'-cyclic phosphodiesterase [Desulfobulbus alkaliphilus]